MSEEAEIQNLISVKDARIKELESKYNAVSKSADWWKNKENAIAKCWADNCVENVELKEEITQSRAREARLLSIIDRAHGVVYRVYEIVGIGQEAIDGLWNVLEMLKPDGKALATAGSSSIPVKIECPKCGRFHIDKGEWVTKPHKTHLCEYCKHEWRPFPFATVGVEKPKTKRNQGKDKEHRGGG